MLALRDDARMRLVRLIQRTGAWLEEGRVTNKPPCAWPTGWKPCCGEKATWPCCKERPRCMTVCACWRAAKWPACHLLAHPA